MTEKKWKFIEISEIPPPRWGVYGDIIADFMESEIEVAKVDYNGFENKKLASVVQCLRKASKGKARVVKRGKDIILVRLEEKNHE